MHPEFGPEPTLLCPVCRERLSFGDAGRRSLGCPVGHRFDAARQGYFNLLTGKGTSFREDTSAMVAARAAFQDAGHYAELADAVAAAAVAATAATVPDDAAPPAGAEPGEAAVPGMGAAQRVGAPQGVGAASAVSTDAGVSPAATGAALRLLDAGAGTGYYLRAVSRALAAATDAQPNAVALDISRHAMRRAAKVPHTTALVWDLWRELPLETGSVDLLLNVFAPRNGAEFHRVLAPGGIAIVVTPLPEHLAEAAELLGLLSIAAGKEDAVAARLGAGFEPAGTREVRTPMRLSADQAADLALMGPAGHHLDAARLRDRLQGQDLPPLVTAAFRIQVFRRA
jgi:23S rRNA (guanine745-N1)-methyltransferase